ncbi:MAG TPA: DUF6266 family protein [Niastella sp.]
MAQMSSGLLGSIRGKAGDKVYYVRKGKQCVRSVPKKSSKEPSRSQLEQRAKMAKAIFFVSSLKQLLSISYRHYFKHRTPSNEVVKQILRSAITGVYPDFNIDYSKVLVSLGHIAKNPSARASAAKNEINFAWNTICIGGSYNNDRSILIAYCEALNRCIFTSTGPIRRTGEATLPVPDFRGQLIHTWLSFISEDGKNVADSVYTGAVWVT